MALALDVSGILAKITVKEVSVVQSIDIATLQGVLLQLVSRQAAAENQLTEQREVIDGLKAAIEAEPQAEVGKGNTAHSAAADTDVPGQDGNKEPPASVRAWQTELQQLKKRVADLERQQSQDGASQVAPQHSTTTELVNPQPAHTATAADAAHTAANDSTAIIDILRRDQDQLAQQVARLQESLAETADSIQQQLSAGLHGKADASMAQALQELVLSKADVNAVDQLRTALAEKANQSEIDVLLNSLSSSMHTSGTPVNGDTNPSGTGNADVAGEGKAVAATTRALQLQLTLLQDRLGKKADASELDNAAASLEAAHQDVTALKLTISQLSGQLADVSKSLSDVQHIQQTGLTSIGPAAPLVTVSAIPATTTFSVAPPSRRSTSDRPWDLEIQQVLARLAAVEAALRAVPPAAPTAAHITLKTDSKGPTFSGTQVATSALGQIYAGETDSTLQRLAADAADLRCQVEHLKRAVDKLSCSRNLSAIETMAAQRHQAVVSTEAPSISTHSIQSAVPAAAGLADRAVGADGVEPALDHIGQELDAGVAVMLGDLCARLAGLQALVDNLMTSKADRGEVERVQTMLADTATQSDTDMLRHKLEAQQQQLVRLQSITQRMAGSTAAADTATSPRAIATQAAALGASPVSPSTRSARPADFSSATAAEAGDTGTFDAAYNNRSLGGGNPRAGVAIDTDQVLAGIEQVAQAVCLLATGQATTAAEPGPGADRPGFRSTESTAGAASRQDSSADGEASWTSRGSGMIGPHMARLKRLLQTGQIGRKLDWFDPTLLQKMAQRLAATEALIKNAQCHGGLPSSTGYGGDLEARVKRLAAELRLMKERLGDIRPPAQGGWRGGDGDHTILAAKPLAGYRCMACDRPLGSLDPSPGPYLPSGQMPLPGTTDTPALAGKLPPAGGSSRRNTVQDAVAVPGGSDAASPDNLGRRVTGQQNRYASSHGPPAEQLPRTDVGPQLPPGGWRSGQSREDGNLLPALPPRGGSPMGR